MLACSINAIFVIDFYAKSLCLCRYNNTQEANTSINTSIVIHRQLDTFFPKMKIYFDRAQSYDYNQHEHDTNQCINLELSEIEETLRNRCFISRLKQIIPHCKLNMTQRWRMVHHNCLMLYSIITLCGLIFIENVLSLNNMDLTLRNDGLILLNMEQ